MPRFTVADAAKVTVTETVICPTGQSEPTRYTLPPMWDVLVPVDGVVLPGDVQFPEGYKPTRCTELSEPMVILFDDTWFAGRQASCTQLLPRIL